MGRRTALVTGHMGFVGRHMVKALEARDYEVTGIDIKEGNDCRDYFKHSDSKFDVIVHLAAIVGGRAKIEGDPIAVATDLSIDAEMFNWATRTRTPVIYYSSSAAYPIKYQEEPGTRLKESMIKLDDIKNPDMTYGWSKLTGEYLAKFAKVPTFIFRPFSGYGEDQDLDYPFPSLIKRAKEHQDPFLIWGDGSQTRDWIHIDDIVEATLHIFENSKYMVGTPVNLGSGFGTSFLSLAKLVTKAAGYSPDIAALVDKPRGVNYRVSDNSFMLTMYKPKISLLQGIERALNYEN